MALQVSHPPPRRQRTPHIVPSRADLLAEYNAMPANARIDERTAAAVLLCSTAKLQRDRWAGGGIPFQRVGGTKSTDRNGRIQVYGGRVFYLKADIEAHLSAVKSVSSTTNSH